jgi:hypothetical protein
MFELSAFIDRQRTQKLVGAIKEASKLIADCPDPQKQWACNAPASPAARAA